MILMNKKKGQFYETNGQHATSVKYQELLKEYSIFRIHQLHFFLRNRMLSLFISICDFAIFFYSQHEPLRMGL